MAYLDILVLECLTDQPRHGYEIKRTVQRVLGGSVSLNNNVLYPALRRFEEMGAVDKTVEQHEGRPPRHVYRLTDTGREILDDLVRDFPPEAAQEDAEFLIRVAFFDQLEPAGRHRILEARRQALRLRLEHLERMRPDVGTSPWSQRVLDFVARGVGLELDWIEELLQAAGQ
jgi:DNA-binding PadR family transcriptional regulator